MGSSGITISSRFNKIAAISQLFERDVLASGRFTFMGLNEGYSVYKEVATGHIIHILAWDDV
jgi:hypothetical protein